MGFERRLLLGMLGFAVAAAVAWAAKPARSGVAQARQEMVARFLGNLPPVDRVEVMVLGPRQFQDPDAPSDSSGPAMPGSAKPAAVDAGTAVPGPPQGFSIKPYQEFARIKQRTTVTGPAAESLAALWRRVPFDPSRAKACHKPSHGLRFWSGGTLLLETSVSWDCHNFFVPELGTHIWWGFDADAPPSVALLKALLAHLPPQP